MPLPGCCSRSARPPGSPAIVVLREPENSALDREILAAAAETGRRVGLATSDGVRSSARDHLTWRPKPSARGRGRHPRRQPRRRDRGRKPRRGRPPRPRPRPRRSCDRSARRANSRSPARPARRCRASAGERLISTRLRERRRARRHRRGSAGGARSCGAGVGVACRYEPAGSRRGSGVFGCHRPHARRPRLRRILHARAPGRAAAPAAGDARAWLFAAPAARADRLGGPRGRQPRGAARRRRGSGAARPEELSQAGRTPRKPWPPCRRRASTPSRSPTTTRSTAARPASARRSGGCAMPGSPPSAPARTSRPPAVPSSGRSASGRSTAPSSSFGCFEFRQRYDKRFDWYAKPGRPGVNPIAPQSIAREIRRLRDSVPAPIFIAYPHWGVDYDGVQDYQRAYARQLIDAGVDLIVGHGAHVLQMRRDRRRPAGGLRPRERRLERARPLRPSQRPALRPRRRAAAPARRRPHVGSAAALPAHDRQRGDPLPESPGQPRRAAAGARARCCPGRTRPGHRFSQGSDRLGHYVEVAVALSHASGEPALAPGGA